MLSKYRPSQGVWYGITSVVFDPHLHKVRINLLEKTFLVRFVRKVNKDEPCHDGD